MNLFSKQTTDSQTQKTNFWLPKWKEEEGQFIPSNLEGWKLTYAHYYI